MASRMFAHDYPNDSFTDFVNKWILFITLKSELWMKQILMGWLFSNKPIPVNLIFDAHDCARAGWIYCFIFYQCRLIAHIDTIWNEQSSWNNHKKQFDLIDKGISVLIYKILNQIYALLR